MLDHTRPLDTRLPEMLRSGRRLRGLINPIASPAIVEMVAFAGFDYIMIDNEHGPANFESTENMLRAARASGMPTIVRCLEHDIGRTLDLGPSGLLIPMVNTAEQARRIVASMKYPRSNGKGGATDGQRGSAFSTRAAGYGAFGGPEHLRGSNDGVVLLAQCETPQAVANVGAIAAVDGVDLVFIGSNDLSHSMGHENRLNEAPVQAAIKHVLQTIARSGKCAGIPALSPEEEDRYTEWGARLFMSGTTGLIMKAFREVAAWPREPARDRAS